MIKNTLYKYLANNGILITALYFDGMKHIPMYHLIAEEGMTLTNGKRTAKEVDIEAIDLDSWKEIPEVE
jgi:hypothetical protein